LKYLNYLIFRSTNYNTQAVVFLPLAANDRGYET